MRNSPCDLCEGVRYSSISETDRHGKPLTTVICETCGLVSHAVIPSEEELREFYSTNYREEYNGERTPGNRRIMRAWNNGLRISRQISPLLKKNSRILEVGAGIGCTVKVFQQAGFEAEGIDPGGEFLKFSQQNLNANVTVGNLCEVKAEQAYDGILLIHVIEHLPAPKTALLQIAKLLKTGGMFYVECPNLQAPFARRSQLFHSAHIHNFVPSTLQMLAEACGFKLRQRFGDERDPNLQMLFEYTGDRRLTIDSSNFERTVRELGRSDSIPYMIRTRYLTDRLRKLAGYAEEHLRANSFVQRLIEDCDSEHQKTPHKPARKAA